MTAKHWLGPVTALVFIASPVSAGIVNVDLNGLGGATHAGSDGVLSSTGTVWNGVPYNVDASSLVDETGASTATSLVYLRTRPLGPFLDFAALNNLQDDGMTGEGFEIRGLDPNTQYTLAIYSTANAVFNLYDAAGNHGGRCSSATPTYLLPGIEGRDYCRFLNLVPLEVTPGVYGIRLNGLQGSVTGWQLLGTPPPDVTAPTCSGTVLAGTPGGVEMHIQDTESGLASIQVTVSENATGLVPSFAAGTRNEVVFTLTQVDPYQIARMEVTSRDVAGNSSTCSFEIAAATPPDLTGPTCSGHAFEGPPAGVTVSIQDTDSGLGSIVATQSQNANVNVSSFPTGSQDVATVEITQIDPYQVARVELASTDVAGNSGTCVFEIAAGTPPPPVDADPPLCSGTVLDGPPARLEIRVQDSQSGLASITLVSGDNATVNLPEIASGTTEPVVFTVNKADPSLLARIEIASSDVAGNTASCVFEIPAEPSAGPCQNAEGCCEETMGFYRTATQSGQLSGTGPGNSGIAHRRIFERQLERICELIGGDHPQDACRELAVALKRVDGQPSPEDFVTGPSAPQMAERIRDLEAKLACSTQPVTQTTLRISSTQIWREPVSWGLLKSLYDTSQ
jgi:hypothetical protein